MGVYGILLHHALVEQLKLSICYIEMWNCTIDPKTDLVYVRKLFLHAEYNRIIVT